MDETDCRILASSEVAESRGRPRGLWPVDGKGIDVEFTATLHVTCGFRM